MCHSLIDFVDKYLSHQPMEIKILSPFLRHTEFVEIVLIGHHVTAFKILDLTKCEDMCLMHWYNRK